MSDAGPALVVQSDGVGVQSTTIMGLVVDGVLPRPDAAIFADTGWEPAEVYEQLDHHRQTWESIGVPFYAVQRGNLRADHLNPDAPFQSMPLFVRGASSIVRVPVESHPCTCEWARIVEVYLDIEEWYDLDDDGTVVEPCERCGSTGQIVTEWEEREVLGRDAMGRRQCTHDYKLRPVRQKTRELLGYPMPRRVPRGVYADTWVGFSADEVRRMSDRSPGYARLKYPLIDLRWTRQDCERYLADKGWRTVKSACIGCPFHGNAAWRRLRDEHPDEWADAVAFDAAIRNPPKGSRSQMRGEQFLHRSLLPLSEAPIDKVSRREWTGRQVNLLDLVAEDGDPDGCSPYGCRSGLPVDGGTVPAP